MDRALRGLTAWRVPALLFAIVGMGGALVSVVVPPPGRYLVLAAVASTATVAGVVGIRRNRPRNPAAWYLQATACGCAVAASLASAAFDPLTGVPLDVPFVVLVPAFGAYVAAIAGYLLLIRGLARLRRSASVLLDAAIVTLLWGYVTWVLVGSGAVANLGDRWWVGVGLVVASASLVGVGVVLVRRGSAPFAYRVYLVTSVTLGIVDLLWLTQPWSSAVVIATLCLVTATVGFVMLSPAITEEPTAPTMADRLRLGALVPYLVAPALPVFVHAVRESEQLLAAAVALVATALAVARVAVLVAEVNAAVAASRADLAASEEGFRLLAEQAPDVIWRLVYQPEPRFEYVSPASEQILGIAAERLTTPAVLLAQVPEEDRVAAGRLLAVPPTGPGEDAFRIHHPDGSERHLLRRFRPVRDDSGEVVAVEGITSDVTERWLLDERANRLAEIVDSVPDLVFEVDRDGRLHPVNAASRSLLNGLEAGVETVADMLEPLSGDRFRTEVLAEVFRAGIWQGELDVQVVAGLVRPCSAVVVARYDEHGEPASLSVVLRDIAELREAQERLRRLATTDPLTGLANRSRLAGFLDALDERGGRRAGDRYAVLYLDLDGFKECNDRLGHAAGDEVLVAVAELLGQRTRPEDLVCRLGGDEFCAVLVGVTAPDAVAFAERLVEALGTPLLLTGGTARVSSSIGVAVVTRSESAHNVLRRADEAMFAAKRAGKDRVVLHPGPESVGVG